ncbi:hypothetical protein ACIA74_21005 [Streptomyces sp. NPDC051658]|uniref:hypothetical protein n=1 Tax=Streptomyces sp. NPDC051658 TaxID=3365667 RepID=UPI0037B96C40
MIGTSADSPWLFPGAFAGQPTAWTHASCIKHHLGLAGRTDQLFTEDAITLGHTTARGFSRAVNNLCLQALVATFATGKSIVDDRSGSVRRHRDPRLNRGFCRRIGCGVGERPLQTVQRRHETADGRHVGSFEESREPRRSQCNCATSNLTTSMHTSG